MREYCDDNSGSCNEKDDDADNSSCSYEGVLWGVALARARRVRRARGAGDGCLGVGGDLETGTVRRRDLPWTVPSMTTSSVPKLAVTPMIAQEFWDAYETSMR